jgi:PKD repeat protein
MKEGLRILLLFTLIPLAGLAQQVQKVPELCATMEQDSLSRLRFPERGTLMEFEEILQKKIRELEMEWQSGRKKQGIIRIPIIVHVVHNGEPVGTGPNISQAQVQAQIEVLNEDFRRKAGTPGFNNHPAGADIEIEFCLSPIDQNGTPMSEPGVHRYNGGRTDWTRDQIEGQLKPLTIWNPNLFYNIWTVRFAASDANLLGYAQFPDQSGLAGLPSSGGSAATDGVVVRFQSFGSVTKGNFPVMQAPYNRGRTLSHETGHWLGLRHIWGDGPCSADDFVSDTPPQESASSGCPIGRISCSVVNMIENYMDYTNDECMNIFTQGQKNRMHAVIQLSPRRRTLMDANLCEPFIAAAPVANFYTDKQLCILLGSEVQFTDISLNFPNSWRWQFEGGDPATSTIRNPRVKYNIPGSYKVSLIATNSLGSDTLTFEDYIVVSEEGLCGSFSNFEAEHTPSVLNISDFTSHAGYLTGHNSAGFKAFSEFFPNSCGYKYISGLSIKFTEAVAAEEDAFVTFMVWNARGVENGPGAVIERKEVLVKQILDDLANNRPTTITFDRETPLFSRAFHVGVEIRYNAGYSLAIISSANGQATGATSWVQESNGIWQRLSNTYGVNIAMDIEPIVGANLSVQVSASKLLTNPSQEVILNGSGASIFIWNADDGSVVDYTGPQLIVKPTHTTTYITSGSGLPLCNETAYTTIYVRDVVVIVEDELHESHVSIYPNPGKGTLAISIENNYTGEVQVAVRSVIGQDMIHMVNQKTERNFSGTVNTDHLSPGMYIIIINTNGKNVTRKWMKVSNQ